ncbi:glycosyltransferase family 2 protein [Candidatus Peribacteria bacterium]|nr:glycosyltransferase family 2 protein [Candidatus Peribacteria bacterium]
MSDALIPCTVQVLTHNNASTIRRNLDSLREFGEVIVQDGYSTDGTREIAREYPNVRLLDQDRRFLGGDGYINDFSSMRNLSIFAAKYDWIFPEDADEYLSPEVIKEIRSIVECGVPGVYQAFRRFFINGEPVMHSSGYPAMQIRLFHRLCTVTGYRKPVHELLTLQPNVLVRMLRHELPLPLPPAESLHRKYRRYLDMEAKRHQGITFLQWLSSVVRRSIRTMTYISLRTLWIRITPRSGKRMPIAYEWQAIEYSFLLMILTFPLFNRSPKQ